MIFLKAHDFTHMGYLAKAISSTSIGQNETNFGIQLPHIVSLELFLDLFQNIEIFFNFWQIWKLIWDLDIWWEFRFLAVKLKKNPDFIFILGTPPPPFRNF